MKHNISIAAACLSILLAACSTSPQDPFQGGTTPGGGMTGGIGGTDDTDSPTFNTTIEPYAGQKASDASQDAVKSDEDLYHELSNFSTTVSVEYAESKASVTTSSAQVITHTDGAHVVVDLMTNSVKKVNIRIKGASSNGSLKIYGENKFLLTLEGVDLTSQKGPAINSQCKKRMFVELKEGTYNRLKDSSSYVDDIYYLPGQDAESEDRKGCLFSEGNLVFSGTGVLEVAGKKKHAIATDGYFYMRPGTTIAITEAAKNGLHVKGDTSDNIGVTIAGGLLYANVSSEAGKAVKTDLDMKIEGGQIELNTSGKAIYDSEEKDTSSASCIKTDGSLEITGGEIVLKSTGTGGKGISCDAEFRMKGGKATISTTGGKFIYSNNLTSSPKGIKAEGNATIDGGVLNIGVFGASDGSEGLESKSKITVNGGETYVYAYDDAINSGTAFEMNGGKVFCHSSSNDGLDSNGQLVITGGLVIASGATSPEESFDSDNSTNFKVTGGVLIGIAGGCTSPSGASTQYSVLYGGLTASKGQNIGILDSKGELVLAYKLHRSLSGQTLFVSCPGFAKGQYTVQSGGTVEGSTSQWNGYYYGGEWKNGSSIGTFNINSIVTTVGTTGGSPGGGPGGGGPGGGFWM